ncbi:MAG TPA: M20/M25/M40 family metallo-hydrolase [Bryobacteraceae bacterium]|nr:M20/M25/M40 family metallo-hydrolase [Bryobacteraceae bacterium]
MRADVLIEKELLQYCDSRGAALIESLQTLVRTPSENTPPTGAELACQEYCAESLAQSGYTVDRFQPDAVEGLRDHPLYRRDRDYTNRPVIAGRRAGTGGGRSLILSGHMDTVPCGTLPWTRNPFDGAIESGRLYGRGSNDMKAGIATNLFVARAFHELGLPLRGTLTIESVVDEEFGGVNGTLASRLRGYLADAAVISEASSLRVCPAQRGGRTAHITFEVPNGGILSAGMETGVADQLGLFLSRLSSFAELRKSSARRHPLYAHVENHVPVSVLKIHSGPWGTGEPMATASTCRVELYWQTMPGEDVGTIDAQFRDWMSSVVESKPQLFPVAPSVSFPVEWLPAAVTDVESPFVHEFTACVREVLGAEPDVAGIEGPCDMFVFNQTFGIPAVLWGARGGNTHAADEYVEIDSVLVAARALLLFAYRWCA